MLKLTIENGDKLTKGDEGYTEAIIHQHTYGLTFDQQRIVKENVDKANISVLSSLVFPDEQIDNRCIEYTNLRRYIAKVKRGFSFIELSKEQIELIEEHCSNYNLIDLTKLVFPDAEVKSPLDKTAQTVDQYVKAASLTFESSSDEYSVPKSGQLLCRKINKADPSANFDANDLTNFQKKCIDGLRRYLQSARFLDNMRIIESANLKEIFEETFIHTVYNKPELNSEELNMCISLCMEYVNVQRIERSRNILTAKIDSRIHDDDEEGKKLYLTWVEELKRQDASLEKSKSRTDALQKALSGTYKDRMKELRSSSESMNKLVEAWKGEEGRRRAIIMAEARNLKILEEKNKIESASEYLANVFGLNEDEILFN